MNRHTHVHQQDGGNKTDNKIKKAGLAKKDVGTIKEQVCTKKDVGTIKEQVCTKKDVGTIKEQVCTVTGRASIICYHFVSRSRVLFSGSAHQVYMGMC